MACTIFVCLLYLFNIFQTRTIRLSNKTIQLNNIYQTSSEESS